MRHNVLGLNIGATNSYLRIVDKLLVQSTGWQEAIEVLAVNADVELLHSPGIQKNREYKVSVRKVVLYRHHAVTKIGSSSFPLT